MAVEGYTKVSQLESLHFYKLIDSNIKNSISKEQWPNPAPASITVVIIPLSHLLFDFQTQ